MPAVLITGASRGLGFEFAKQYAVEGWRVIACCRKPEDAIALKKLAPSARDMFSVVAMDVADNDTVRNAALALKNVVVDILINSAGIAGVPAAKHRPDRLRVVGSGARRQHDGSAARP